MTSESTAESTASETTYFRPSREHYVGAFFMFILGLIFVGYRMDNPLLSIITAILVLGAPLLFALNIHRSYTKVTPTGLEFRYLLSSTSLPWEEFGHVRFAKNGKAEAVTSTGASHRMPGVTFNALPALSAASHGHIADPVTPARDHAHNQVQVVHKDGYAVLMDPDEYAEYEAQRRAEYAERHPDSTSAHRTDDTPKS